MVMNLYCMLAAKFCRPLDYSMDVGGVSIVQIELHLKHRRL